MVMAILAPWTAHFETKFDLESTNAGLRRRLASAMLDADADTLEGLSRLIRLQLLARQGRDDALPPPEVDDALPLLSPSDGLLSPPLDLVTLSLGWTR